VQCPESDDATMVPAVCVTSANNAPMYVISVDL